MNGADGIRTHDLLHAMQALSLLSYGPAYFYNKQNPGDFQIKIEIMQITEEG